MIQPSSRYFGIEIAEHTEPDGRVVRYLRRRVIPREPAEPLAEHRVAAGDRLDNVTARYLGDVEQFWRICDANLAERPDELTEEIGRALIIPMPRLTAR